MRIDGVSLFGIMMVCAACSGTTESTTGTGAAGGGGSTGGDGGAGTAGTTGTGGAGGTAAGGGGAGGSGGCAAPAVNVYSNSAETGLPACNHPVAPLPEEDGTFAVTVFGPFGAPFQLDGFELGALKGTNGAVTDPWTAAVILVPAGEDPLLVDPSATAKPHPLTLVEELQVVQGSANRYSITLDAPIAVGVCDSVVVALRNTVGSPSTALQMCGTGSDHPETNQWWNLDGTMTQMSTYGAEFDRDWWVTLRTAPGN